MSNEHPDYDDLDPDDPRRDWGSDYWGPIERAKADREKAEERELEKEEKDRERERENRESGWSSNGETFYGTRMSDYEEKDKDPKPPLALPVGVDRVSDLGTLLTLREASERLGLSVKTVRRMIDRGNFAGAHQVPMASGKGLHWVVPYSEVVKSENTAQALAPTDKSLEELTALRDQVAQLSQALQIQEALATERAHQLEQLHTSFRALMPAQADRKKRRWRKS